MRMHMRMHTRQSCSQAILVGYLCAKPAIGMPMPHTSATNRCFRPPIEAFA